MKIKDIVSASRPKTLLAVLPAIFLSFFLAIKTSNFDIFIALLILAIGISLQVLVNFFNDYSDFLKGVDTDTRVGPTRSMQSGNINKKQMQWMISINILLCIFLASIAIKVGGMEMGIFGAILILIAYLYTGGPLPYGYIGLGELMVVLIFGPAVVLGGLYLFGIYPNWNNFIFSLIPGLTSSLVILVNNIRDAKNDVLVKKNTIAVILGERKSRFLYLIIIGATSALLIYHSLQYAQLFIVALFAWLVFPTKDLGFGAGIKNFFRLDIAKSKQGKELNLTLGKSVVAHFLLNTLLLIAIAFDPINKIGFYSCLIAILVIFAVFKKTNA
jgi:1,4-dihydroxy-2-naphthoate octaprenyltransferase